MATVSQSPMRNKRTNSLGRAKESCQNCSAAHLSCDRSRPRCLTCNENGITCSGYKMNLTWQFGIASRGNLAGFNYSVPNATNSLSPSHIDSVNKKRRWRGKSSRGTGERLFKFVEEKSTRRRGRKDKVSPEPAGKRNPTAEEVSTFHQDVNISDISLSSPSLQNFAGNSDVIEDATVTPGFCDELDQVQEKIERPSFPGLSLSLDEETNGDDQEIQNCIQLSIMARNPSDNLRQKYHYVLSCYDQHICAIPLTSDCFLNPFRVLNENKNVSQHLLHAVVATSLFHLHRNNESTESTALVDSHRSESIGLYSRALSGPTGQDTGVAFLDTALLLMYLDSAQSAIGLYRIHLQGIRSIIDSFGGESLLIPYISRLRAQLAMFIWYDATIALLSREDLVLPLSYLEGVLRHGRFDGWNYEYLIGCREEFVVILARLARLAKQYETSREMENLYFDMTAVDEVEETLQHIPTEYPYFDTDADEETLDLARDRYHCGEAWRNGLLLYIQRIFRWTCGDPAPLSAKYIARIVIEHVRCIRRENNYQKQVLIAVFLAGAEMKRDDDRDFVRGYTAWWSRLCGSKMFDDACSFLEEVWTENDGQGAQEAWWGSVIDRQCLQSGLPQRPQVLLG